MAIDTKRVTNRRKVRYQSYDDLLRDAERLSQSSPQTLGNWSPGQIYDHLAESLNSSIDGTGFALPAPMRWVLSLLMKKKFLTQEIPAGFKASQRFQPAPIGVTEGLNKLRSAIERVKRETLRARHPAFGQISREEWDQFNLRHAELHMSFLSNGNGEGRTS